MGLTSGYKYNILTGYPAASLPGFVRVPSLLPSLPLFVPPSLPLSFLLHPPPPSLLPHPYSLLHPLPPLLPPSLLPSPPPTPSRSLHPPPSLPSSLLPSSPSFPPSLPPFLLHPYSLLHPLPPSSLPPSHSPPFFTLLPSIPPSLHHPYSLLHPLPPSSLPPRFIPSSPITPTLVLPRASSPPSLLLLSFLPLSSHFLPSNSLTPTFLLPPSLRSLPMSPKTAPPGWVGIRGLKWNHFLGSSWNFLDFWLDILSPKTPNQTDRTDRKLY